MNKRIQQTAMALIVLFVSVAFSACEDLTKNISVNIPITPTPVEFKLLGDLQLPPIEKVSGEQTADIVLAEAVLNTSLKTQLSKEGYNIDQLKALTFDKAEVEVKEPKEYPIDKLVGIKVYFEEQLVGEIKKAANSDKRVEITINKTDMLKYAEKTDLKVTIKGKEKPRVEELLLLLHTKFTAKVSK